MIFIGPKLSMESSHFRMNISDSIGSAGKDLYLDLRILKDKDKLFSKIDQWLSSNDERYIIYNPYEDDLFIFELKEKFPDLKLFAFFSDDDWRGLNYDRYIALFCDSFSITIKENVKKYLSWGFNNVNYIPWAGNQKKFYPIKNRQYKHEVTFIGAAYGKRIEYARFLIEKGIPLRVFGNGWNKHRDFKEHWGGFLSSKEFVQVINESKINLNFLWASRNEEVLTVKGRTFEIPCCMGFQLCNDYSGIKDFFEVGKEIDVFGSKDELYSKVVYYLNTETQREKVAHEAYRKVSKTHTWDKRFEGLFNKIEQQKNDIEIKANVLVVDNRVERKPIQVKNKNLKLVFSETDEMAKESSFDGIIYLKNETTIDEYGLSFLVFGLQMDRSEVALSNFYLKDGALKIWIRFRDVLLNRNKNLLKYLPLECMLFAKPKDQIDLKMANFSYVEIPTFNIKLDGVSNRKRLRAYFGHYDKLLQIKKSFKKANFFNCINIVFDFFVQKKINNR